MRLRGDTYGYDSRWDGIAKDGIGALAGRLAEEERLIPNHRMKSTAHIENSRLYDLSHSPKSDLTLTFHSHCPFPSQQTWCHSSRDS
jgi:hypothetical protein